MAESQKIHLYLIPGLGVDHRLFQWLEFPEYTVPHYWNWEAPHPKESIRDYAKRYVAKINSDHPAILLGVSFGGVIAQEVAKLTEIKKTILISSLKHHKELPWYFKIGQALPLYNWVAPHQIKSIGARIQRALGDRGTGAQLFESMLASTPDAFMPWAVEQLIYWKQTTPPANLVHYHGTNDHVLPSKYISDFIPIEGGTHAMIMVEAKQMNELLRKELLLEKV